MPVSFDVDLHNFKQVEVDNLSMGQNGAVIETGTTAVTGSFYCIYFVEGGAFSALTMENLTGDAATGLTFAAGGILFGRISAFTLASGKVIAYKYA